MNIFMLPDPKWIIEEMHRPYVEKGAAWMDETQDKWIEKIIPDDLDLSSTDLCICGQMFGSYSNRPEFVNEAHDFGFCVRGEVTDLFELTWFGNDAAQTIAYQALDRLWLDEIFWRRGH